MAEIKAPVFPESIAEGTLASWHKKTGDSVEENDIIAEIETDKVMMEVPAGVSGVIGEIKKQEGDTVLSGEVIALLNEGERSAQSAEAPALEQTTVSVSEDTQVSTSETATLKAPAFPESIAEGTVANWHKQVGDAVEEGETLVEIETDKVMMEVPSTINGVLSEILKQNGDTVVSEEVLGKLSQGGISSAKPVSNAAQSEKSGAENRHLSPSARRAVADKAIDVSSIQGSGKKGRITKADIRQSVSNTQAHSPQDSASKNSVAEVALPGGERPEKRVRMTRLRQTIARRLVEVQHQNALLTTFNEVDMQAVMAMRKQYKEQFQKTHNTKLGFMSFFLKAATEALKRYPEVNASIDGNDVVYHGFFDIGVAVGTDRGLVVPVIRNTDQKSFAEIESGIVDKAIKARDGKLSLEEMQGGTFTITNGGTYGSMLSTPIINAPQSAILGMHNIVERRVVVDGEIVVRPIMYLALSYDHRIIDGSVSVKFLKMIKEMIEDPARMLLEI